MWGSGIMNAAAAGDALYNTIGSAKVKAGVDDSRVDDEENTVVDEEDGIVDDSVDEWFFKSEASSSGVTKAGG